MPVHMDDFPKEQKPKSHFWKKVLLSGVAILLGATTGHMIDRMNSTKVIPPQVSKAYAQDNIGSKIHAKLALAQIIAKQGHDGWLNYYAVQEKTGPLDHQSTLVNEAYNQINETVKALTECERSFSVALKNNDYKSAKEYFKEIHELFFHLSENIHYFLVLDQEGVPLGVTRDVQKYKGFVIDTHGLLREFERPALQSKQK